MQWITLKTSALVMIRAVFFDWFNTLAHNDPPRYQLHVQACHELGINVSPEAVKRGISVADRYFFEENTRSPVEKRSPEEKGRVYAHYQDILMGEARVSATKEQMRQIRDRVQQLYKDVKWVLFDDVLSTLEMLKARQLVLGMLTNATRELLAVNSELGLEQHLDFVVISEEVGDDKPRPPIFLAALERAGVSASEAMHIGDQYQVDVVGARGVGINPVLLDRSDVFTEVTDCPRIRTLPEIADLL